MRISPAEHSAIFDSINTYTNKREIVRSLQISTGKSKKYLETLYEVSKKYRGKRIWILPDLATFFHQNLNVLPFFRPEFFLAGYDWNGMGQGSSRTEFEQQNHCHYEEETITYVTACGLKKMLLILSLGEQMRD